MTGAYRFLLMIFPDDFFEFYFKHGHQQAWELYKRNSLRDKQSLIWSFGRPQNLEFGEVWPSASLRIVHCTSEKPALDIPERHRDVLGPIEYQSLSQAILKVYGDRIFGCHVYWPDQGGTTPRYAWMMDRKLGLEKCEPSAIANLNAERLEADWLWPGPEQKEGKAAGEEEAGLHGRESSVIVNWLRGTPVPRWRTKP